MSQLESGRDLQEANPVENLGDHDHKLGTETVPLDEQRVILEQKRGVQAAADAARIQALKDGLTSSLSAEKAEEVPVAERKDRLEVPVIKEGSKERSTWFKKMRNSIREWLDKPTELPDDNILYKKDRMYRCIGASGYEDFIKTGVVRSRNRRQYVDVSFNKGGPAPLYYRGSSGEYILEATPDAANFGYKTDPFSGGPMTSIGYRGISEGELTRESPIRIFRKVGEKTFEVVFDNIGDEAFRKEE